MDALDILKSDHERMNSLYDQLKTASVAQERKKLFGQLHSELLAHTQVEETVFYPAFKNYPDFQSILSDSYEDHRNIRNRLKKVSDDGIEDTQEIDSIMRLVTDHFEREENELFPMVRKLMKRSERETLGRHLQAAKSEPAAAA